MKSPLNPSQPSGTPPRSKQPNILDILLFRPGSMPYMAGLIILCAIPAFPEDAQAQCNNATVETPAQTAPASVGCGSAFSSRRDRHRVVSGFVSGAAYTISSSGTGTWITVRTGSVGGAVLAFGDASSGATLNFTADAATLYIHVNSSAACGTSTITRNLTICQLCPLPTYAVFNGSSHAEGFESWINDCATSDAPSANWYNSPATGNTSWRRNDEGSTASWSSATSGAYAPTFTEGGFSARWHSNAAGNGGVGTLDLYIDMSAATGDTELSFDYINASTIFNNDNLTVWQSTNGGGSFTQLGAQLNVSAGSTWESVNRTITSTSATTVVRFRSGRTSSLSQDSDLGIDNLRLSGPCSGTPSGGSLPLSILGCPATGAAITATGATEGPGISFQWEESDDDGVGDPWANAVGGSGATTLNYTTPTGNINRWYRLRVTCANGGASATSTSAEVQGITYAAFNGTLYTESFEGPWQTRCSNSNSPSLNWANNGNACSGAGCPVAAPWRRHDQGGTTGGWSNTTGVYSPVASDGSFSARFHSYNSGSQSPAQTITGSIDLYIDLSAAAGNSMLRIDHINTGGGETVTIYLSTNGGGSFTQVGDVIGISATWTEYSFPINTTSATTVIRLQASRTGTDTSGDIGVDNLRVVGPCSGIPGAGSISGNPAPACPSDIRTLTFTPDAVANLGWIWQSSTTSGSGFSDIAGSDDLFDLQTGTSLASLYYRVITTCLTTSDQNTSGEFYLERLPGPLVSVSPVTGTFCAGSGIQLTASGSTSGYTWAASPHLSATTGAVVTATPPIVGTFTYTVTSTDLVCPGSATATITTTAAPYNVSIAPPSPAPFCIGNSVNLTATRGIISTATVGTANGTSTGGTTPFERSAVQRRITYAALSVAQLSAAGIPAGASLRSLSFDVTDAGSGNALTNFSLTVGGTVVFGPTTYSPVAGANAFVFSSPLTWNGSSTLVVQVCYNNPGGASPTVTMSSLPSASQSFATSTAGTGCTTGGSSSSGSSSGLFPLMTFGYTHSPSTVPTMAWTPTTGLTPGTGIGAAVNAAPTTTTVYTTTASFAGCDATASVTVTVHQLPIATAGGSETICALGSTTLVSGTATFGTPFWTHNGTGGFDDPTSLTPVYTAGAGDLPGTSVTLTLTVTSNNVCNPQTDQATYTVNIYLLKVDLVLGAFACGSTNTPDVVFLFTGTPPYNFTYTFNGGSPTPVVGHGSGSFTIPAAPAGTYAVTALSDASGCAFFSLGAPLLAGAYPHDLFFVYAVGNNYQQVTWSLYNKNTGFLVQTGGVFSNGTGSVPTCLPTGCFYLRVTDSGGDGIAGGYVLQTIDGRRIIDNTGNFTNGGLSAISGNGEFCLPLGDDRPIFTSCDKYWWRTGEYLVATENAAVSALWVPNGPNGVQPANTGYEYWWYNPNGNYSFRKFRPHNVSDGFGNVGATRACHVRLNNWVGNQLPGNRWLNVKVRGVVNGVAQNWGPACRFRLDEALAACPPTQLLNAPGDVNLSCGQTRTLQRGQRVYANAVRGATHYQWRFRVPAEEPTILPVTVITTNYILNLNTVGLIVGKTYDVEVRASLDGTTTWCGTGNQNPATLSPKWGTVCLLTIVSPPAIGGQEQGTLRQAQGDSGTGLRMWPNPNRGDQLRLSIEVLEESLETVTVDLYDLSGQRVVARVVPTQGGYLNTTLELNGELAAGMYLVQVTAGDKVYTERLVVQP